MSKKCRAYSESKLGLAPADSRKAFYAGWDAALREALAQSRSDVEQPAFVLDAYRIETEFFGLDDNAQDHPKAEALYRLAKQPAQQQEPVSLNDGRLTQYADGRIGVGTPQEPVQEPVQEPFCYLRQTSSDRNPPHGWAVHFCKKDGDVSVYTAPPQRKPLTDEQIEQCMKQAYATVQGRNLEHAFARAIEAAHGIKGDA